MKKLILLVAALLCITAANAQFSYGLKLGMNISGLSNGGTEFGSVSLRNRMKTGFLLGAVAVYDFNHIVGIQAEVDYSRQGAVYKFNQGESSYKGWLRLNYINIPVLAKLYVIDRIFSVEVGPQFGFNLNGRMRSRQGDVVTKTKLHHYKTFDFSLGMGLSYKITPQIDFSARYNLGLTDVLKNNADDKMRNNVIQLGLTFRY